MDHAMTGFITTAQLVLRPLTPEDATDEYLTWLNDPDVLRFRGPKAFPTSLESLKTYVDGIAGRGDLTLAIWLKQPSRHVGNVTLNAIRWVHHSAELSIMIGARDMWGKGLGKEAIYAVTRHAFERMGLRRLWAESPNPAFNAAVRALGWAREGTKREAFLLDGEFVDMECYGILKQEFVRRPELDTA